QATYCLSYVQLKIQEFHHCMKYPGFLLFFHYFIIYSNTYFNTSNAWSTVSTVTLALLESSFNGWIKDSGRIKIVGLFNVTALLKSIAVFHCLYCSPNKAITISAFCIKTFVRKLLTSEAASSLYTCSGCFPRIASPMSSERSWLV